jgi:hypothetical protein
MDHDDPNQLPEKSLRETLGEIGPALHDLSRHAIESFEPARTRLETLSRAFIEDAIPRFQEFVSQWKPAIEEAMPPNWLPFDTTATDAVKLMRESGWSLVWTPPRDVLERVLAAPDREMQRAILLSAERTILKDLDGLLEPVDRVHLRGVRDAAVEALAAHKAGHYSASQALSGAVLSTIVHQHFGQRKMRKFHSRLRDLPFEEETGLGEFRVVALLGALARVLEGNYNPLTGRPVRYDFNRHATAHRVDQPQYRPVNSLTAIMLVTCLVVELDASAEAGDAEVEDG